nr:hypothetical protein [Tanacetum cinerariifolium]
RHQTTQQYGAILPIELTTDEIRNNEGTGSKPGVPDVPSDDSEEELLWNSSDDEDVGVKKKKKQDKRKRKVLIRFPEHLMKVRRIKI